MTNINFLFEESDELNSVKYFRWVLDSFRYSEKYNLGKTRDIIDSFSLNQLRSKKWLINVMEEQGLFKKDKINIGVLGCWYGTVLFPGLLNYDAVHRIIGYDMDGYALSVSNRIFQNTNRVKTIEQDIWCEEPLLSVYHDVVINTSCEHMPPMSDWKHYRTGTTYIFQSTNKEGIKDHINCVDSIIEFKEQMHPLLNITWAGEIESYDCKRFMIIGDL